MVEHDSQRIFIDYTRGVAQLGSLSVPVAMAGPGGELRLGGESGVALRPLTFRERSRLVAHALASPHPRENLCAAVLQAATGGAFDKKAESGKFPVDLVVQEILALHLAGAETSETPAQPDTYVQEVLLLGQAGGWELSQIEGLEAAEVDCLVHQLVPTEVEDDDWRRFLLVPGVSSTSLEQELATLRTKLADNLLGRGQPLATPVLADNASQGFPSPQNYPVARSDHFQQFPPPQIQKIPPVAIAPDTSSLSQVERHDEGNRPDLSPVAWPEEHPGLVLSETERRERDLSGLPKPGVEVHEGDSFHPLSLQEGDLPLAVPPGEEQTGELPRLARPLVVEGYSPDLAQAVKLGSEQPHPSRFWEGEHPRLTFTQREGQEVEFSHPDVFPDAEGERFVAFPSLPHQAPDHPEVTDRPLQIAALQFGLEVPPSTVELYDLSNLHEVAEALADLLEDEADLRGIDP